MGTIYGRIRQSISHRSESVGSESTGALEGAEMDEMVAVKTEVVVLPLRCV